VLPSFAVLDCKDRNYFGNFQIIEEKLSSQEDNSQTIERIKSRKERWKKQLDHFFHLEIYYIRELEPV
jgi:hypothetical protein